MVKKSTSGKKDTAKKTTRQNLHSTTHNKKRTGVSKMRMKKTKKKIAINIRRSSGRKEKFDLDRMTQTTSRSGVPFMMARDISKNVSKKISSEAKDGKKEEKIVTADRVRKMIGKELRKRNEKAIASSYAGEMPVNRQSEDAGVKIEGQYASPIGSADTDQHEAYRADADSVVHDKSKRHQSST
jgi:transcriptional repressor NrdR